MIKRNYLIFFYIYFCAQVVFIIVNAFLPIYFFNILNVNRIELAFIQIFAYSALFSKPIIALYFDKTRSSKKIIIIVSSFGLLISYILFILNIHLLIVFGIFLGLNFAFMSIIDVAIDKIIIESSLDEKSKDRNATYTQMGSIFGAIFPNVISFIIFTNLYSISTWHLFFLIGMISIFPIIFMGFLLTQNAYRNKEEIETKAVEVRLKPILLLCIILFLAYGERIYEYPFEPWVLQKYGEEYFSLFLILLIILILLNGLGVVLAGIFSNKINRKKILIIASLIYGFLLIIAPFTDIITFFILFGIMQICSGFIILNLISLMIKESKKEVIYFQIMVASAILAIVIFVPLGTFLSVIIGVEYLIVIAGVLKLISIIPILFFEDYKNQT